MTRVRRVSRRESLRLGQFLAIASLLLHAPIVGATDLPGVVVTSDSELQHAGTLCGGADLDNDGVNDIVGSTKIGDVDLVMAYDGRTGAAKFGIGSMGPGDTWGTAVRFAGDVDLDGVVDIVAASKSNHYIRVISGANGAILRTLLGSPSGFFGWSVDGIGDFDGDGSNDIVVSTPGGAPSGYVQTFQALSGVLIGTYFPAPPFNANSLINVLGIGDTNNDGFDDIAYCVGQSTGSMPDTSFIRVHVVRGPVGSEPFPPLLSGQASDGFAIREGSLRRGTDLDGDGNADLLVGAFEYDNGPVLPRGRVFAFSGVNGALLQSIAPPASSPSTLAFGLAIAAIGDLEGDALPEIAVGDSTGKDPGVSGTNVGVVRVYSGSSGNVLRIVHGLPSSGLGASVSEAGDMNGNGRPDLLASWHPSTLGVLPGSIAFSLDCGDVSYFGNGCPGAGGATPTLNVLSDCFSPGVPLTISVVGLPFGPNFAWLAIGGTTGNTPIHPNCSFLVGGAPVIFPIAMSFTGLGTLSVDLPLGFVHSFAVQAFVPAPGTPLGYSATRGALVDVD